MLATLSINKDKETTKLINNLGLEWENDPLSFHKNKLNVKIASNQYVGKKIYTRNFKSWYKFEPYLKNNVR